jgi:large subunit ribosomal protein L35
MGYKLKPNKSVLKRFKITKTGKVKRHHCKTSHLMSARTPAKKRELRGTELVAEGFARNIRRLAGVGHLNPARAAHLKAIKARKAAAAVAAATK